MYPKKTDVFHINCEFAESLRFGLQLVSNHPPASGLHPLRVTHLLTDSYRSLIQAWSDALPGLRVVTTIIWISPEISLRKISLQLWMPPCGSTEIYHWGLSQSEVVMAMTPCSDWPWFRHSCLCVCRCNTHSSKNDCFGSLKMDTQNWSAKYRVWISGLSGQGLQSVGLLLFSQCYAPPWPITKEIFIHVLYFTSFGSEQKILVERQSE